MPWTLTLPSGLTISHYNTDTQIVDFGSAYVGETIRYRIKVGNSCGSDMNAVLACFPHQLMALQAILPKVHRFMSRQRLALVSPVRPLIHSCHFISFIHWIHRFDLI